MRQLDLDPEILASLKAYVNKELLQHKAERVDLEDRIIAEQKDFWAEPGPGTDTELPVIGFASLVVPLTAIAVEAIHARTMGQLFGLKELVTVETSDKAADLKSGLDKFFNHEFLNTLEFRKNVESPLLQLVKHGTAIMSVGYRETKHNRVLTSTGEEISVPIFLEKGTCIDGIPVEDFIMPFYAQEIYQAAWVGHNFRVSEFQVKQMVATGILAPDAYENLRSFYTAAFPENRVQQNQEELTNTQPILPSEMQLSRILLDWDVDGNGELTQIEVIYHLLSNQILSVTYYEEDRNYEKGVYMPLEFRWYGYGVAKMNNTFQEEVTAQHRQRLDNATIANMAMFKIKKRANWIKDDEPIFPGKKWFVEEMDDIEPLFIGDVKASAYNNENQVVIYSQQRTGVNELTLGMPNVGTPGTASDSMARVQESNRKFDYQYNNAKDFLNRVTYRAAQSIIKHGPTDRTIYEALPKGPEIELFLRNKDILNNKLLFNIQLAGAKNNKVLDRNTYTQLAGMATQYWTQVTALVQQVEQAKQSGSIVLVSVLEAAIKSANDLFLEILRAFDIPNPEKHVFNYDSTKSALPQPSPAEMFGAPQGATAPATGGITSVVAPNARIDATGGPPQFQLPGAGLSLAG